MSATLQRTPPPATTAAAPSTARALRAVVRQGLRRNRRAPLTWGVPLGAMSGLTAALWPAIKGSIDGIESSASARRRAMRMQAAVSSYAAATFPLR